MSRTRNWRNAGLAAAGLAMVVAAGCAGYSTWPPRDGSAGVANPNARPNDQVMLTGLRYVVERYPADSETYALNLPQGLNPRLYKWIADRVGEGAEPLTTKNQAGPIYHVKEIKVRGSEAQLLVLRPVTEAGPGPHGSMAYQPITITMRGGVEGWHVVRRREWVVGLEETPRLNFWDPIETADASGEPG